MDGRATISLLTGLICAGVVFQINVATAAVTVDCQTDSINAAISNARAGVPTTINVSGTCIESVRVAPGKIIMLNAASGTLLKPKGTSPTALRVEGQLTVDGMTIRSGSASGGSLVEVGDLARFFLKNSILSSTIATKVVQGYTNSVVVVENSSLSGGTETTLEVSNNSLAFIFASGGKTTTLKNAGTSSGQIVGCWQGQLTITTFDTTSKVVIGPSGRAGISSRGCQTSIGSFNSSSQFVTISGAVGNGIESKSGDSHSIRRTELLSNGKSGLEISAGVAEIDKSTISNNASGVWAGRGAIVFFNNIHGASTVSGPNPYSCYQGGSVYADSGAITGATSTNCLKVGGTTLH